MARGTVRKTSTNWWAIVDGDEQPLATFDHDDARFAWAEPGALVDFEADGNDKFVSMTLASAAFAGRRSPAFLSGSLVGALRITPPRGEALLTERSFAPAAADSTKPAEKPKAATPSYVTSVALLFPVEAATLFPVGQSIAGDSPVILAIVILATVLFVIALRYYGTQDQENGGKPAWSEIWSSVFSLLLWIGATKGYWVASAHGLSNWDISAEKGAGIFGFITIMWVALAPYLVKETAKHSAATKLGS